MTASPTPRVQSASYTPCPACDEGTLAWDPAAGTTRCVACGEVH